MNTLFLESKKAPEMRKVYVVITKTGSLMSKAIYLKTRQPYNHASLCFSKDLDPMYSFNASMNGFIEEKREIYKEEATCSVYSMEVPLETFDAMKARVEEIKNSGRHFNWRGIFGFLVGVPAEDQEAYFCSEFVAAIFHDSGIQIFDKPASAVQPYDFAKTKKLKFEKRGKIRTIQL